MNSQRDVPNQKYGIPTLSGNQSTSLTRMSAREVLSQKLMLINLRSRFLRPTLTLSTLQKENSGKRVDYELTKLGEMNTWSEVNKSDILMSAQILPGMWVHAVKKSQVARISNTTRLYEATNKKTNLSLSEIFVSVSHISSLQIILALASLKDLHIFAWDIDSAYLHGR